ncbi:hypothetical protein [Neolewinella agarilytica]|uniref:hypothetical protein n=1 Tax=Neolewinella agarilytica TaxID=478744 RepID=UPI002357009E|nr:hypothetical protein [Neolewinella agarilytica]
MLTAFLPLLCHSRKNREEDTLPVKGQENWLLHRFSSAEDLKTAWPEAGREDNFWISPETLAFQVNQPQGLETEAIALFNKQDDRQILLTTQTFYFNAAGQVSNSAKGDTSNYDFRRRLLTPFSFKVLCLGQFLTSGPFAQDGLHRLSSSEAADLLPAVAATLTACNPSYVAVLIKDLYPLTDPVTQELQTKKFHLLPADPVMELHLEKNWETMDDYLASLTSKYRVRYRRARSKFAGISRRRLSSRDVAFWRDRMYELYRSTSAGADFNAANLTPAYFPWLARVRSQKKKWALEAALIPDAQFTLAEPPLPEAGDNLLFGYFNAEGEMIGFTSAIPNGSVMHAHYLGMENSYKHSHHLYHNMLFDLLEDAIAGGFNKLDYGRTALEIKSSIGAVAVDYACLIMARPRLINWLIPFFTSAVYKAPEWTARNPFRQ